MIQFNLSLMQCTWPLRQSMWSLIQFAWPLLHGTWPWRQSLWSLMQSTWPLVHSTWQLCYAAQWALIQTTWPLIQSLTHDCFLVFNLDWFDLGADYAFAPPPLFHCNCKHTYFHYRSSLTTFCHQIILKSISLKQSTKSGIYPGFLLASVTFDKNRVGIQP